MATESNKGPWWLPLALAAISIVASGYVGYSSNDKEMAERVSKVEAVQDGISPRLDRIENKIEKVDDKIDRVLSIIIKELQ